MMNKPHRKPNGRSGTDRADRTFREEIMLAEYEALQLKIERSVGDLFKIETVIPIAIAAFYTWLAKEGSQVGIFHSWLLWLPVMLVVIGLLRQEVRYRYLGNIERYLMKIEEVAYKGWDEDYPEGWERYYRRRGSPWNRHLRRAVWIVLLAGSATIAWTGGLLPSSPKPEVAQQKLLPGAKN